MTRAMLRRPFTAMRPAGNNQVPEYYGKSRQIFPFKLFKTNRSFLFPQS